MTTDRILLLEDRPVDAQIVRNTLEKAGYASLDVATSEIEFVDALKTGKYLAIVSDNSIPGASADHSFKLAREWLPGVPFISISGAISEKDGALVLAQGAADYISKDQLWRLPYALRRATGNTEDNYATDHSRLAAPSPDSQESLLILIGAIQNLSLARTLDEITAVVRTAARRLVKADGATFVIKEREDCYYADEDAILPLWKGSRFPQDICLSGWVMRNKEQTTIPDITTDSRVPQDVYASTFVKSLVMTPVRRTDPIAAIGTYWAKEHTPSDSDKHLLQMLADTTSVAIDNVCLFDELESRVDERTKMLETANEELKSFSYSVAHDLKSPLHGIHQISQMLLKQEKFDQTECKTVFEAIGNDALRMTDMIAALLKLYSLSLTELHTNPCDLSKSSEEILTSLARQQPERNVNVTVQPNMVATGDPALFHLVLENLINNAWKYTSKVAIADIEIGRTIKGHESIFFVRDNGAGFDMKYATKLFRPFQRLHTPREFEGTGIGLATVHRIVNRYGGRVWAESAKGEGTTFFFTLPV